jgi:hypothetical protein
MIGSKCAYNNNLSDGKRNPTPNLLVSLRFWFSSEKLEHANLLIWVRKAIFKWSVMQLQAIPPSPDLTLGFLKGFMRSCNLPNLINHVTEQLFQSLSQFSCHKSYIFLVWKKKLQCIVLFAKLFSNKIAKELNFHNENLHWFQLGLWLPQQAQWQKNRYKEVESGAGT